MVAYNKFDPFVEAVNEGIHDFATEQLTVALTNAANPPVATDAGLADLTEIVYTNLSSRNLTTTDSSQTGGVYTLDVDDLVLTASGGPVAAFQYVVIYNSTNPAGDLICWFDNGSEITLQDGENITIRFSASGLFNMV